MRRSMKTNDGCYIAVVEYRGNDVRVIRMEEDNAIAFARRYKNYIVVNGATGALVSSVGSITDKMWDIVTDVRKQLREPRR